MATNRLSETTTTPTTTFRLQADVLSQDAEENESVVRCYLTSDTSATGFYNWHDALVRGRVNGTAFTVSGNSADYTTGQDKTWGPYDITVPHNADGTKVASLQLEVNYPHAADTGGTKNGSLTLPTLTVAPGTPTGVALARNSDTLVTLSWTNTGASNGQATQNLVQKRVNGGAWTTVAEISAAGSLSFAVSANQRVEARVRASNSAGNSSYATSGAVYTSPAAPTAVTATKTGSDIVVAWTPHVAFTQHTHVVEHSSSDDGGSTWSAYSALTSSVAAGTSSYTHTSPNAAHLHRYRVRARNAASPNLTSSYASSNTVQLLAAPAKPTIPTVAPYQDKAADFVFAWVHNPIDTTAQTKYQVRHSLDGGDTWTTGSKTASTAPEHTFAGSTFSADDEVTIQVRTKGDYDSGGDGDASYSPWSDPVSVTFKTRPVATIETPADESTWEQAALTVDLGFTSAESGSFVNGTIKLYLDAVLVEELSTTSLDSTVLATRVADGETYTLKATVLDSWGLLSDEVEAEFEVDYTEPVAAGVTIVYHPDSGVAQINLTIPEPGAGEEEAVAVTITRTIGDATETVADEYPVAGAELTILDTTPTIHGENTYTVTTLSADGAAVSVEESLTTDEGLLAFLSTGPGFSTIISFFGNLRTGSDPDREKELKKMAGRTRPIALFGPVSTLDVRGSATLVDDEGSTYEEIEEFLLTAGLVCYRDPTGRRVFGALRGSLSDRQFDTAEFSYTVSEAT